MKLKNSLSRSFLVLGLAALAILMTGCLVPPSSANTKYMYSGDGPDPAWVPIYYGVAEVYMTDSYVNGGSAFYHIPSYITPIPNPHATGSMIEALPTLPTLTSGDTWAPTVRLIGGQYVMLFSESVAGRANCIGWATSAAGNPFTPVNSLYWCSANPSIGFLDPDLFVTPSGAVWMIYSQQGAALSSVGGSQLVAHQLIASGLGIPVGSSDYTLVTYDQVASFTSDPGPNHEIENPSMTSDDYNGQDLTFSLGTWTSNATELTGEIPCLSPNGNCIPGDGAAIMKGDGGASAVSDGSPSSNWLIWHTFSGSNRVEYGGSTTEIDENPSSSAMQKADARADAAPLAVTQTPTAVVPYTWKQRVVNPYHPHLVIGYTGPRTTISPSAQPVTGPSTMVASG
jgi:hypothetical protein